MQTYMPFAARSTPKCYYYNYDTRSNHNYCANRHECSCIDDNIYDIPSKHNCRANCTITQQTLLGTLPHKEAVHIMQQQMRLYTLLNIQIRWFFCYDIAFPVARVQMIRPNSTFKPLIHGDFWTAHVLRSMMQTSRALLKMVEM